MIFSQYGTVFTKSDYGKIKKVYSIWTSTNPTLEREYSITLYKMTEDSLVGAVRAPKRNYDISTGIEKTAREEERKKAVL